MIGVFDSGLGGLSILKHFLSDLPEYDYIYLGDNARVPYGNKSSELIYHYSCQAVDFLFSQGAKLIIFACNSASSQALRKIQTEYLPVKYPGKNVLGVIVPLVEKVVSDPKISKVGVIGTRATINSHIYREELLELKPDLEVLEKATPLLVPLIEENWLKRPETRKILKYYLRELKMKEVQALILACTHYPFLLKEIRQIMGKSCKVYNPGEVVAFSLKDYLSRHSELDIKLVKKPQRKFFATDKASNFKQLGEKFLGEKIEDINYINLNDKL
ncbi:MAG: glutamate racemase [Candidatus Pacebacteria bacterium]|nr:glutamate racemase [Candidatus Paceibacterota bacterium]